MVRRIALEFVHRKKGAKIAPESYEIGLAMAFILAESKRKAKTKIKHLTPVSIPFWIVQVSDTKSIVLSSIGDDSIKIEVTETTAIGPVRRILTNDIVEAKDVPPAVDKALPMVKDVEKEVHHVHNLREPEVITRFGRDYVELEPTTELHYPDMKVDSQIALSTSEEYQCIVEDAQTRLSNMEELEQISQNRLTDQVRKLDNVIASELGRLERRYEALQSNYDIKVDRYKERLSEKSYRLRDQRKKDEKTIVTQFARELVDIERFFASAIEQTKTLRTDLAPGGMDIKDAVERYKMLMDDLRDIQSNFDDVADKIDDLADTSLQKALDLDEDLKEQISQEEVSIEEQISVQMQKLSDLKDEIDQTKVEFEELQKSVSDSVTRMENAIGVRIEQLRHELSLIQHLSLDNNSVKGLAPLTQLNIKTYVVTYNRGAPLLLTPIIMPEDRFGLPYEQDLLDGDLDSMIQKTVKKLLKDNPAFKTSYEKVCIAGNEFQNLESMKTFKKGIDEMWNRQLLDEGVRDSLVPMFTTMVGQCPECKADIGTASKFCPECGAALV
ncbi:MAG: hypothetical protein RTU30_14075 [Candidatus Thorarchaeota archaeon]